MNRERPNANPRRRRRAATRRFAAALAALIFAALLAACDAPADYPPGVTDTERWERNDIRIDTEVPNQYPNGTTREVELDRVGEDTYGGDDHDESDEGH